MRYAVVYEKAEHNWSAYAPDLPGCIATGKSIEQTRNRMAKAIEMHLEGMREDGDPIPTPTTEVGFVDVADSLAEPRPVPAEA